MMDIEKLIERLRTDSLYADKATLEIMDLCMEAADALSTLQAENSILRKERDAAVEDFLDAAITPCSYCKHGPINGGICDMDNDNHEMFSCWEWRGPEEG